MFIYDTIIRLIKTVGKKKLIPIIVPTETGNLFADKIAFISGGSGGIGMAIAKVLLEGGCKVILGGTNIEKLNKCKAKLLSDESYQIETYVFDANNIDNYCDDIKNIVQLFGRIDIYINSLGVHTEKLDIWNLAPKEFDRVMKINLESSYFACIEIARYMIKNNVKGHMLVISSSRGFEPAWSPYGISKWALNGMIEGLAQQFIRFGITINGIAPGPTATQLIGVSDGDSIYSNETKVHRLIRPEEIALYARLLVSDASNMISGEIIRISGGRGIFDIR